MAQIFISYSRKDLSVAEKIIDALAIDGLEPWIDWKSIPKGEAFEIEIHQGIEKAEIFLFLVSPDSAQSDWCKKEIAHAIKNGKRILPIVIRDTDPKSTHPEISKRNWIFCRDGQDDFSKAVEETHKTIHMDYEWLKYHTELQVKALKWEKNDCENSFLLHGKELGNSEKVFIENLVKAPFLTELQIQFIARSRAMDNLQITERKKTRVRLRNLGIVLGVIAIVAIWLGGQVGSARIGEQQASETAMVARDREKEQATIALARQLTVQAQSMFSLNTENQIVSGLLVVQSLKLQSSSQSSQIIQNITLAQTDEYMIQDGPVRSVTFSADDRYIMTGGCNQRKSITNCSQGIIRIWEIAENKEITQITHGEDVSSVAFSPNGNYIVSGSVDGTACVWETLTGKEVACSTHESGVTAVSFSPNGKYVASGSWEGSIHVWDVITGKEIARMIHEGNRKVSSVAFSEDSSYLVSGSWDFSVHVWEISTGKETARMMHDNWVLSAVFSPDGRYVVSGGADYTARVWEAKTGIEIIRVKHDVLYNSIPVMYAPVSFSPDGKYIVSGSGDNIARVWEVTTGKEIAQMNHNGFITSVAFSFDGKYVISGSIDGTARVWETFTGKEIVRMPHGGSVNTVAFSPNSQYIASGSDDGTTRVWKITAGGEVVHIPLNYEAHSVAISPSGNYVLSAGCERDEFDVVCIIGNADLWESSTGKKIAQIPLSNNDVSAAAFSSDGNYVILGGCKSDQNAVCYRGDILIWEIYTGREIARLSQEKPVTTVAVSPDGKYLASGSWDNTARVWEIFTGREIALVSHTSGVKSVAFSPNGQSVASGSDDGTIRIWGTFTGKEISQMNHDGAINSVAFTLDGRYVVSGSQDNTIRVWVVETGKELMRINLNTPVYSVSLSPDGQYIISGGYDNNARIWELATGKEVGFMKHSGYVNSVAFSPDGEYAVSGSADGIVRVWKYHIDDLIDDMCSRITRNLTRAEWKQFIGDALPYQAVCPNLPIESEIVITPSP